MILVDYSCPACGRFEAFVSRPIPEATICACGEQARRVFASVALGGRAARPTDVVAASRRAHARIPGLCAAPPEAQRAVIARYTGDVDTYAAEKRKQTERFEKNGAPARITGVCAG